MGNTCPTHATLYFLGVTELVLEWEISSPFPSFSTWHHVLLQVKAAFALFLISTTVLRTACILRVFFCLLLNSWLLIRLAVVGVADKISAGAHGPSSTYILNQMQLTGWFFFFFFLLYKCEIISSRERRRSCFLEDRVKPSTYSPMPCL